MKTERKNKKGISLIVLVITIIVMIILAAAVIISLSNAGIIGKASEATVAADIANIKTQVEIIKADAQLEAIQNNETLTQAKLIEAIQKHFKGSTVSGNIITVKNGKYDIVVQQDLSFATVQHGKYDGPIKDIEVSYTTTEETEGTRINLTVKLLNVRGYDECNEYELEPDLIDGFLNGLDLEALLTKAAIMDDYADAKEYYEYEIQPELINPISYEEFMNSTNRNELVKESSDYETAEVWLKNKMANLRDTRDVNLKLSEIVKAKDMFPELANKSFDEMKSIIEGWYNNEKTLDQIIEDTIGDGNFEFWYNDINWWGDEEGYIYSKEQVLLMCTLYIYAYEHPVIIQYPDGTEEEEVYWGWNKTIDWWSFTVTGVGNHNIKVIGPSGYVETIIVSPNDTVAPTVNLETNITPNSIRINVTAVDKGVSSGIKEYRYYIKGPSDADYVLKAKTTETTYTYTGLNQETKYEIVVGVEDNAGNIGKATKEVTIWITDLVNGVPIPKGFVASQATGESTKDGGLVIYEGTTPVTNSNVETAKRTRNQYVWVPVDDFSKFVRQNFGKSYTISTTLGANYWEVILDLNTNMPNIEANKVKSQYMTITTLAGGITNTLAEVQAMYESVKAYKGFYIARYEAGLEVKEAEEGTTDIGQRTLQGNAADLPGIKEGTKVYSMMNKIPYNYIPWTWNNKMDEDTNGAVDVARRMYPESNTNYGVVSTLTYGVQWDRTLAWWVETKAKNGTGDVTIDSNDELNDSINYGNYKNNAISAFNDGAYVSKDFGQSYTKIASSYSKPSLYSHLLTTGATEETRVNNIYDMAGNVMEWTMEGSTTYHRILRGGYYRAKSNDFPVSIRVSDTPYNADDGDGFRSALYIKK